MVPPQTSSELLRGVLAWYQLTKHRSMLRLQLMHRCMQGLVPEYFCSCFQTNSTLPNHARTREWNNVHLHQPNTDWYKKSFESEGLELPNELKSIILNRHSEPVLGVTCNIFLYVYLHVTFSFVLVAYVHYILICITSFCAGIVALCCFCISTAT